LCYILDHLRKMRSEDLSSDPSIRRLGQEKKEDSWEVKKSNLRCVRWVVIRLRPQHQPQPVDPGAF
ncbi:MAG: hypothetical protein Q9192_006658, partial [Flavoplaca navasiana]